MFKFLCVLVLLTSCAKRQVIKPPDIIRWRGPDKKIIQVVEEEDDGHLPTTVLPTTVLDDPWNKKITVKLVVRKDGQLRTTVLPVTILPDPWNREIAVVEAIPESKELVLRTTVLPEVVFWTGTIYVVRSWKENRDCLWNISDWFYETPWRWPEIYTANKFQIKDPDLIYPGQALRIP